MASTIYSYNLTGGRVFPVAFEYLARRFVRVALVGATRRELILNVDYRFISKTEIETTIAWTSGEYQTIEIRRVTSATDRLVNFTDGSILRSQDLNISQIQAIHIAEEGRDVAENSLQANGFQWNALGLPIKNVGYPALPTDAANGQFVSDNIRTALRVTPSETIDEIPSDRANRVLAFDSNRQPIAITAAGGSSMELELRLRDMTDPANGAGIVGYRGEKLSDVLDRTYTNFVFSRMKADGNSSGTTGTDNTEVFQAELNALKAGDVYITPPGYCVIRSVICPTKTSIEFKFAATRFIIKAGHDPLDNEMVRFNSLSNSWIDGFYTDGNMANIPDSPLTSDMRYGRVLNWRLGDGSENVRITNLTMVNSQYCGSQWGKNIRNVTIDGITYDNIGEHVFYISGTGGGNNKHLKFLNTKGGSLGVNPRNRVGKHECAFVKSSQTVGINDFWEIDNIECVQGVEAGYAALLLISGYLGHFTVKNVALGDNMAAVLYPTVGTGIGVINGVRKLGTGTQPRLIYSHVSSATIGKLMALNVDLTGTFTVDHMQLFDLIEDCVLPRIETSQTFAGEFAGRVRTVLFNRCTFLKIGYLKYVDHDIKFVNCTYASAETGAHGSMESIGLLSCTAGKWVIFESPRFIGAHAYSLSTQNDLIRLRVEDATGPMSPIFGRASTKLTKLILDTAEVKNGANPVAGLIVGNRKLVRLISEDGVRDWASYNSEWTIATGQSSTGNDLTGVLAVPFTLQHVQIQPITSPQASGITSWWPSMVGDVLTINTNTTATVPLKFSVKVQL